MGPSKEKDHEYESFNIMFPTPHGFNEASVRPPLRLSSENRMEKSQGPDASISAFSIVIRRMTLSHGLLYVASRRERWRR